MKNQALFSSKDESKKKNECRLLQFLFGALWVKHRQWGGFSDISFAVFKPSVRQGHGYMKMSL